VKLATMALAGALLSWPLSAETLGFIEQKFSAINFEKGKWDRTAQSPCFIYAAKENGAVVDVLRIGMGNLVPFRATKDGLKVIVCGSTAAFDEGFEAERPVLPKTSAQ
jgi:hypothetical protein